MILECKSCLKKFKVPDNAIPTLGRLVQCSSCGNKWTQFPQKNEVKFKDIAEKGKKVIEKKFTNTPKKKKTITKKSGPSIYSKEYLEKKHGIKISGELQSKKKKPTKNNFDSSYFGFYSYLITTLIFVTFLFGLLNLTKEILIIYFPFIEPYIENLYENINNFKILIRDAFNFY